MARNGAGDADVYAALRTRAHWKPEQAARVLSDWSRSGESMAAFARRHRLGLHRLHWWRERLRKKGDKFAAPSSAAPAPRLVPAVIRKAPLISLSTSPRTSVCIAFEDVRVEVQEPNTVDVRWLGTLVSELRGVRS